MKLRPAAVLFVFSLSCGESEEVFIARVKSNLEALAQYERESLQRDLKAFERVDPIPNETPWTKPASLDPSHPVAPLLKAGRDGRFHERYEVQVDKEGMLVPVLIKIDTRTGKEEAVRSRRIPKWCEVYVTGRLKRSSEELFRMGIRLEMPVEQSKPATQSVLPLLPVSGR